MIEVLGLGMGRTGTLSLKLALEKIGFARCYHMETLLQNPADVKYWKEIDRKGQTDWQALFQNYQAAVDFPSIAYYHELLKAFPEAKCILTLRDPEAWYESASETILDAEPGLIDKMMMSFRLPFSRRLRNLIQVFQLTHKFWVHHAGRKYKQKDIAIAFYQRWNEQIQLEIPANRLLVYQVQEGWEPLCDFLEQPVPEEPFPKANQRSEFKAKNKELLSW